MLYFAYGSNMSLARLQARIPSARFVAVAALPEHRLRFHKIGMDGSAKCDAAYTSYTEDQVMGALYEIQAIEKPLLDAKEGLGHGYQDKLITVVTSAGERVDALTYSATRTDSSLKPFDWYLEHVLRGATEIGLPPSYIDAIAAVESAPDPCPERHASELSVYR